MPDLLRPTPAQALNQLAFWLICADPTLFPVARPTAHHCLCCGAKGGYDTIPHNARCPLRVLGEVIEELKPTAATAPPPIEVPAAFPLDTAVTWTEGRTARVRTGVIEAVHPEEGWSANYDVRPLKADGTPAAQLQHRHHSELEQVS